ncbi:predicted protein [Nematostella vectensis]|uniref:DUF4326 domain-containing protein n=1 Tax=Nematostella vectensis TaxID=45351 RepID=A7SR47_NEMVE|nr:predicted protein [Nematostella vectensis]|eukprot:XP_001625913.1 predicted protein [Nematostella vectensis]
MQMFKITCSGMYPPVKDVVNKFEGCHRCHKKERVTMAAASESESAVLTAPTRSRHQCCYRLNVKKEVDVGRPLCMRCYSYARAWRREHMILSVRERLERSIPTVGRVKQEWVAGPTGVSVPRYVVHSGEVYIGRGGRGLLESRWRNLHRMREGNVERSRQEVVDHYLSDVLLYKSSLLRDLSELGNKRLLCWCHPKACHGDVLRRLYKYRFEFEGSLEKLSQLALEHISTEVQGFAFPAPQLSLSETAKFGFDEFVELFGKVADVVGVDTPSDQDAFTVLFPNSELRTLCQRYHAGTAADPAGWDFGWDLSAVMCGIHDGSSRISCPRAQAMVFYCWVMEMQREWYDPSSDESTHDEESDGEEEEEES